MGRLGTPEDLTGASPGTQTQDTQTQDTRLPTLRCFV